MTVIDTEARTVQLPPQAEEPEPGPSRPLARTDTHRLALQAKLTEIGVPPAPEDRGALRQLSELDAGSVGAVVRWLACAAAASQVPGDASAQPPRTRQRTPQAQRPPLPQRTPLPQRPPQAQRTPQAQAPVARSARVLPVPDSAARIDPRLLAW